MGDVLTRKPAGEHIDRSESGVDLSDVFGNRDTGPVPLKDASGVLVRLAGPREFKAGVVEAKVESSAA